MDNRSAFLNTIAQALGRPLRFEPQADTLPVNNYANERLTELSQQQRCDAFIQFASDVMLVRCELSESRRSVCRIRLNGIGRRGAVFRAGTRAFIKPAAGILDFRAA